MEDMVILIMAEDIMVVVDIMAVVIVADTIVLLRTDRQIAPIGLSPLIR